MTIFSTNFYLAIISLQIEVFNSYLSNTLLLDIATVVSEQSRSHESLGKTWLLQLELVIL